MAPLTGVTPPTRALSCAPLAPARPAGQNAGMGQEHDDYDDLGLMCREDAELSSERFALAAVTVGPLVVMSALVMLTYLLGKYTRTRTLDRV
jgi:hypothetical protein